MEFGEVEPTYVSSWFAFLFAELDWIDGSGSVASGYVAVAFVGLMIPILCFPSVNGRNLTPAAMNWSVHSFNVTFRETLTDA